MKNKFLISAAAIALIAGSGFANAQGQPQERGAAPKAQMQGESKGGAELRGTTGQAAPAEKVAPAGTIAPRAADKPAATTGQAPAKSDADVKGRVDTRSEMKGDVRTRSDTKASDTKASDPKASDPKTDKRTGTETKSDIKAGADAKSTTTTGQGAAGSSANLTTEQRTKIRTSIKSVNVRPATNVNFSISIGTRVPRNVHLYPLPVQVVEYYPSWRGYEFILVGDEIIVINPRTLEIVAVIEA